MGREGEDGVNVDTWAGGLRSEHIQRRRQNPVVCLRTSGGEALRPHTSVSWVDVDV